MESITADGISFTAFWHVGTLVLGILVVIASSFVRKVLETAFPDIKQKADEDDPAASYGNKWARWYNKVFVYYFPVVLGGLSGLINEPFLFGTIDTMGGRVLFGMVVAWFCRDIYKGVRGVLSSFAKKQGVDLGPDSRVL